MNLILPIALITAGAAFIFDGAPDRTFRNSAISVVAGILLIIAGILQLAA